MKYFRICLTFLHIFSTLIPVLCHTINYTDDYNTKEVITGGDKENNDEVPELNFTTVIDILSSKVQFSTFLRIIQRSGNILYLNELQNYTLLAPVNSAFVNEDFDITEFDIERYIIHNYMIQTNDLIDETMVISDDVNYPFVIGQSWDPITKSKYKINKVPIVELDLMPNFQNATIQGISYTLNKLPSLSKMIEMLSNDNAEELFDLTFDDMPKLLKKIPKSSIFSYNNTVIVPSDDCFSAHFNSIEINYLLDSYNNLDRMRRPIREKWINEIEEVYRNMIFKGMYGGSIDLPIELSNLNDKTILFDSDKTGSHHSYDSNSMSLISNELYDRGIAHFFHNFNLISEGIKFDVEDYLHGLNCSGFVSEMYFRNIEDLIHDNGDGGKKMTLFVPDPSQNDDIGFSKPALLYHFTDEQIWLEDEFPVLNKEETFTKIFDSSFCSSNKRLGGNCQRMKITKSETGYHINGKYKITQTKPYQVGNTVIYTISGDLSIPGDLILSVPPFAHCSKSISFLRQLNLLELKPNHAGYTIFLPCFDSWNTLALNVEYIENHASAMENVMKNYILDGLYYTDIGNQSLITHNLRGDHIKLRSIDSPSDVDHLKIELDSMYEDLTLKKNQEVFFNQGVLHLLKGINMPKSINISLEDLIRTTGSIEMIDFLKKFKTLGDKILGEAPDREPYSILIPTFSSLIFEDININSTKLEDFLKLHIIRGNETKGIIDCTDDIKTEIGQSLECRKVSPFETFLKVKDGSDSEVRVLKKGCATFGNGESSYETCVFLLDRPISLNWINGYYHHVTLPFIAIAVGVVLGVSFIITLLCCTLIMKVGKDRSHTRFHDRDEEAEDNNDATRPLLTGNSNIRNYYSQNRLNRTPNNLVISEGIHSNSGRNVDTHLSSSKSNSVACGYSTNSTSVPINVSSR